MRLIIALGLAALLLGCGERAGQPTPFNPADYSGKWVVINYWAKWCKPCIEEIPELNHFDQSHDNVVVLGVNYDNAQGEELQAQLDSLGVEFPTLAADPAAQLGIARPVVLPTTVILTPTGELSDILLGPQTGETLLNATLAKTE